MTFVFVLLMLGALALAVKQMIGVNERDKLTITPKRALPGLGLAFLCLLIVLSFTTVSAGTRGVVTRWGSVARTLDPGPHFLFPFVEFSHAINVQTKTVKPNEKAASVDLQVVHTEVTLAYHIDPRYADYNYSQLAGNEEANIITPAILEAIKSQTALYPAHELISKRPIVRDGIEDFVKRSIEKYHIVAETVSITDFDFSEEYNKSIEAKVTAAQHAEKAQNDLLRIKIEAQQQIEQAKGEAEALRAQKEQITPELLQLRTIEMMKEKWDGKLPDNYYGGTAPLPMMEVFKGKSR